MIKRNFSVAAMGLYYKQDHFLKKWLNNLYTHVDKIYIAHSKKAWDYNPKGKEFDNEPDRFYEIMNDYPDTEEKIVVIEGAWKYDEDNRNTVLNQIRRDGYDYCMIIDLDEFGSADFFQIVYANINNNEHVILWKVPWIFLWKSEEYVIADKWKKPYVGYPEFLLRCDNNYKFIRARILDVPKTEIRNIDITNFADRLIHYAYCMDDEDIERKVKTWGHSHQFNADKWLKKKWYKDPLKVKNLHPVTPKIWKCVIRRDFPLKI